MNTATQNDAVDIGVEIDNGAWSGYQKLVLFFATLTLVFDGLDIQVLGLSIPGLMAEWGGTRGDYAPILAISLLGMIIGTIIGGLMGDKFGRRKALIGSVLFFALITMVTAYVNDLNTMTILRFIASLGIGGALPNATTLAAEVTPIRGRAIAVILTIIGVPLGGFLGGLLAENILPTMGWRALFMVGGLLPLIMALVLIVLLPESPRYLVRFAQRKDELIRLMARFGHTVSNTASLVNQTEHSVEKSPISTLFSQEYLRDTLAMWAAYFFCLIATYSILSWLPGVLAASNLGPAFASKGITYYNGGGVFGALIGGYAISRYGSKLVQMILGISVIASSLYLSTLTISEINASHVILIIGVLGVFLNAMQCSLYALVAHVYVSRVRATGTGGAVGFGRIGALLSSFIVPFAMNINGSHAYFIEIALSLVACIVALLIVQRHIPKMLGQ